MNIRQHQGETVHLSYVDRDAPEISIEEVRECLSRTGLMERTSFLEVCQSVKAEQQALSPAAVLDRLIGDGRLTAYQASEIRQGRGLQLLMGNYLILNRIAEGGMGTVFKALHRRMQRVVAIKMIKKEVASSEAFVIRFQQEVCATARLNHPNVVAAYDADECELGHFLVMEFVDGTDLAELVKATGPLPVADAIESIRQAALGLDYAHSQHVIHRDIKPANLLRDVSGVIRIADLGLARFHTAASDATLYCAETSAGGIEGTVDYMSPEQAVDSASLDHRADIYSLGCTLHYLLTAAPVFGDSSTMGRIIAHRERPRPNLRELRADVPVQLSAVFERMTSIDPAERFQSMKELVAALDAIPGRCEKAEREPADLTILLAEPSRMQSRFIERCLKNLGVEDIFVVETGADAIDFMSRTPVDLVLASHQLPDTTGVELAQRIRGTVRWSRAAVLLMTGSQLPPQSMAALKQLAAVRPLSKPFDEGQLTEAIRGVLATEVPEPTLSGLEDTKVLIVEDSAMWRRRMREVLLQLGFVHLTLAQDGTEAVERLNEQRFDLVVTDYNMPRMDGRQLVAHIRQQSSQRAVPIVMVTTEFDPTKLEDVYRLGVSAICNKSFDPQLVRNVVLRLFV